MTGIVKTDQIQGAQGTTVTVPTGHTLAVEGTTSLSTTSSTATIAEFKKSGTTIGHIGVHDDDGFFFTRGATQQGIVLKNSAVMPCNTDGSNSDNDQDLGISSVRWKDLYLSGGVRIGGTGSANSLDDYEEGSWTATFTGSSSNPSSSVTTTGNYIKVGRLVYVTFAFANVNTSGASGEIRITGLPFTPSPGNQMTGDVTMHTLASITSGSANVSPFFTSTYIAFYSTKSATAWSGVQNNAGAGGYLYCAASYLM